eukprot:m.241122 g.241122  ORF g.241122 m.241122 type:complete len:364 (-) comp15317_c0_seq6:2874-3965(-)
MSCADTLSIIYVILAVVLYIAALSLPLGYTVCDLAISPGCLSSSANEPNYFPLSYAFQCLSSSPGSSCTALTRCKESENDDYYSGCYDEKHFFTTTSGVCHLGQCYETETISSCEKSTVRTKHAVVLVDSNCPLTLRASPGLTWFVSTSSSGSSYPSPSGFISGLEVESGGTTFTHGDTRKQSLTITGSGVIYAIQMSRRCNLTEEIQNSGTFPNPNRNSSIETKKRAHLGSFRIGAVARRADKDDGCAYQHASLWQKVTRDVDDVLNGGVDRKPRKLARTATAFCIVALISGLIALGNLDDDEDGAATWLVIAVGATIIVLATLGTLARDLGSQWHVGLAGGMAITGSVLVLQTSIATMFCS